MDEALERYREELRKESGLIVDENLMTAPIVDILRELSNTSQDLAGSVKAADETA